MAKKLYYQLSDNADVSKIVMELSDCMTWIEEDMNGVSEGEDEREFTITPIWLTDEEFENLPEANL
jgi:hypothetical protein